LITRAAPIVALAAGAFAAGAVLAAAPGHDEHRLVARYVSAWERGDVSRMYSLLDSRARRVTPEASFARQLKAAAGTATASSMRVLTVGHRQGATLPVRMQVSTRLWGVLDETLEVPLSGQGSSARVRLLPQLLFPGLRAGERLHRQLRLPPRATILASDGEPLAQGPNRTSPISDVALQVVGTLGPVPRDQAASYAALGYPPGAKVGLDGLERILQRRLVGRVGGVLLAGHRRLATAVPRKAPAVRTTIVPRLERATVSAMGGQYAGMTVIDPYTGGIEALGGVAFSAVQPPGSTMKIITASAALAAGIVKLSTTFPVATSADIDGFNLQNANGEACGGTLLNAFAVSCNSVFAPLGAKLGGARLVAMAERYGFNRPSPVPGAPESTIPSARKIGNALSVGSSAIGQGLVQTNSLQMADVAATVAMGGRRPILTLLAHQRPRFVRVIPPGVANEVQRMMVAVVDFGTGTSAQIPGVTVAGKTGTAELRDTATDAPGGGSDDPQNTDAWFTGYAPVGDPRVVVGALFPNQGAGGQAAAPPVRDVIATALHH